MALRQEQIVFGAVALLLGWWVSGDLGSGPDTGPAAPRGGRGGKEQKAYEPQPVPDTAIALPAGRRTGGRDLFTPPRDTVPLPPMDLERPPFAALDVLAPPGLWGPAAGHMGVLRRAPSVVEVPGLFDVEDLVADGGGLPDDPVGPDPDAEIDPDLLTPDERAAMIAGWRRLYDWIEVDGNNVLYGSIRNSDRYRLAQRPGEDVVFLQVNPLTGENEMGDLGPIPYERGRVQGIHFANNPVNEVELTRLTFGDELGPGDLERAVAFAQRCIEIRHEAPRALEVAEEMLQMAARVWATNDRRLDVAPQLVLARVYEVGFRFEEAFDLYNSLLQDQGQDINPEVWSRLGALQARFRLFDRARASHERALALAPQSWLVRWSFGRFLMEQGEFAAAVEHLTVAETREPTLPESQAFRVGIRRDLAWSLLALGRLADAHRTFGRAVSADPTDENAVSGLLTTAVLTRDLVAVEEARAAVDVLEGEGEGASFELLLALGLDALEEGDWIAARRNLDEARTADPFRAHLALRARSALAERTGHPEVALAAIEAAYQVDPTDPWTLLQRGRLLFQQDDLEGAEASLRAALDHELDFVEALIGMARLMEARGEAEAAERYWERAAMLEPDRANVHARRGWNLLDLGAVDDATASFADGLRATAFLPEAQGGLAWCHYLTGDVEESITLLGELAERQTDPNSPVRVWAEAQVGRIQDHEAKEVWLERFDRATGIVIGNGWQMQEGFGPEVNLEEQAAKIRGRFTKTGRVRIWREEPVDAFLRFEGDVTVSADTKARVGIFLSREQPNPRDGTSRLISGVSLSRNRDGEVQARFQRQAGLEAEYERLFTTAWTVGEPMRLAIERRGEGSDTVIDLYVDDLVVLEGVPMARLGASTQTLRFGVFVEGDPGRSCEVTLDDVRVVRRRP